MKLQAVAPEGQAAGPPQMTEFTTDHPYAQAELVDSGKHFRQKPGEPLAAWLLFVGSGGRRTRDGESGLSDPELIIETAAAEQ